MFDLITPLSSYVGMCLAVFVVDATMRMHQFEHNRGRAEMCGVVPENGQCFPSARSPAPLHSSSLRLSRPFSPSVLYVTGLVTGFAGWLSPVCLLMVAGILYLYRQVQASVACAVFVLDTWFAPVVFLYTSKYSRQVHYIGYPAKADSPVSTAYGDHSEIILRRSASSI